jgi:hypothetical protein
MIRERVFTISTLLALMVLSGVAQAGPKITDHWLNEVRPQQRESDWRSAYALERRAVSKQTSPGAQTASFGQHQLRYYGGPKSPMW